ncbi:MAG: glycosyltransferase [Melioribacteraceae bacterium]|nr:glycosyltransferase [Melioribacteraceae bacterium]
MVAARNEEDNIIDCLESLSSLEYPEEKIEIIIIDDNSTDKTNQLISEFIADKEEFILIKPEKEIGSLKGKTNALANAIKIASGRVIMTTDADCTVSPTWAIELASYYKDDVAMVCGYTDQVSDTNFGGMQSVDFIYLLMIAGGVMNFGKPLSCIGNNMSFRKSVYREVGGYEALPFSVTEDFNLLMAMHRLKKYKIIYPLSPKGMVTSKPCDSLRLLLKQKKRWGVGGLKSDIVGYSVMATGFVTHLMMLLTPFFFYTALIIFVTFQNWS